MLAIHDLLKWTRDVALGIAAIALLFAAPAQAQTDPLAVLERHRAEGGHRRLRRQGDQGRVADFVPEPERIAVFDNDGTLWVEQPMYAQLAFALDRVKAEAPSHPEWKDTQPFKAVLEGDMKTLAAVRRKGAAGAHHGDPCRDDHRRVPEDRHRLDRHGARPAVQAPYTELVYQPMLELLAYLRANGFKTFIVSGGGIEFMRPWSEKVYGIPPEQVVGSSIKTQFEMRDGVPTLFRLPQVNFIDDKAGKPVGINEHIGRRPIAAFGNSDGDLEMLQWTTLGGGPSFGLIVHHTDAEREYAYDRKSSVRAPRCRPRRGGREQMDGGRHEEGLEGHLPVRPEVIRNEVPMATTVAVPRRERPSFAKREVRQ